MNRLRHHRKMRQLTQSKLAEKSHMTQNRVCELESGLHLPWAYEARVLADLFGLKPEALFPDGFKVKADYNNGPETHESEKPYRPDPPRLYPRRDFTVLCSHCRTMLTMRADDYHPVMGEDLRCPQCGAQFRDIVPVEEMRP
jgi:transcriptional regulator with XRE-family HTH domain